MDENAERVRASLERWVTAFQPVVFRAAYLILRDTQAAEDVAQETFIRAYHAALRSDPGEFVRSWLYRIAVNTALNELRRRKRGGAAVARMPQDAGVDTTDALETSSVVSAALDQLPDRLRMVVICKYFLDLTEAETARILAIRQGTVKSRLHDARQLLAMDESLVGAR
jgi:RNA polymerase sigma-70 factor (ECF subfamily)